MDGLVVSLIQKATYTGRDKSGVEKTKTRESVVVEVKRRGEVGPGSELEWEESGLVVPQSLSPSLRHPESLIRLAYEVQLGALGWVQVREGRCQRCRGVVNLLDQAKTLVEPSELNPWFRSAPQSPSFTSPDPHDLRRRDRHHSSVTPYPHPPTQNDFPSRLSRLYRPLPATTRPLLTPTRTPHTNPLPPNPTAYPSTRSQFVRDKPP